MDYVHLGLSLRQILLVSDQVGQLPQNVRQFLREIRLGQEIDGVSQVGDGDGQVKPLFGLVLDGFDEAFNLGFERVQEALFGIEPLHRWDFVSKDLRTSASS